MIKFLDNKIGLGQMLAKRKKKKKSDMCGGQYLLLRIC